MAQFIEIEHPKIEGHTARVAESALERLAEAGWKRVDQATESPSAADVPETLPAPAPVAADTPAPKAKPSK